MPRAHFREKGLKFGKRRECGCPILVRTDAWTDPYDLPRFGKDIREVCSPDLFFGVFLDWGSHTDWSEPDDSGRSVWLPRILHGIPSESLDEDVVSGWYVFVFCCFVRVQREMRCPFRGVRFVHERFVSGLPVRDINIITQFRPPVKYSLLPESDKCD